MCIRDRPKTALLFQNGQWGVPSGRTPTTHILKPPTGEWDGHAENEHFCLLLARASGLVVPNSSVSRFHDEIAIVIERYDRLLSSGQRVRVHQEDMCQALALHPVSYTHLDVYKRQSVSQAGHPLRISLSQT